MPAIVEIPNLGAMRVCDILYVGPASGSAAAYIKFQEIVNNPALLATPEGIFGMKNLDPLQPGFSVRVKDPVGIVRCIYPTVAEAEKAREKIVGLLLVE